MNKSDIIFGIIIFGLVSCNTEPTIPEIDYSTTAVSEPIPFAAGFISTEANSEFELAFSKDGLKVYFSRRPPSG